MRNLAETVPVDSAVAAQFGLLTGALRRAGTPVDTNDLWIAATALANDLTLVTGDTHFRHIPGLRTENWTTPAAPPQR